MISRIFELTFIFYIIFYVYLRKKRKFVYIVVLCDILREYFAKEGNRSIEWHKSAWKVEDKSYVSYMSRFISLGSCGWKTNKQTRTRIRNGIVGASSSANVGRLLLGVGVERCSPRWLPWLARGLTEGPYPARGTTKFFSLHTSIDYFHAHYRQHTYICISLAFVFVPYPAPIFLARTRGGTSRATPSPRLNTSRYSRRSLIS